MQTRDWESGPFRISVHKAIQCLKQTRVNMKWVWCDFWPKSYSFTRDSGPTFRTEIYVMIDLIWLDSLHRPIQKSLQRSNFYQSIPTTIPPSAFGDMGTLLTTKFGQRSFTVCNLHNTAAATAAASSSSTANIRTSLVP
jgi:hypothetical protein